jgi:hypothetical protein
MNTTKLWLSVDEAALLIGDKPDAIYRDIRVGQFPFKFVRIGKRIKISARSLGLIPSPGGAENNEGANEAACLPAAASFRA